MIDQPEGLGTQRICDGSTNVSKSVFRQRPICDYDLNCIHVLLLSILLYSNKKQSNSDTGLIPEAKQNSKWHFLNSTETTEAD